MLVTGGSQGARLLSELVPAAIIDLPEDLRLRLRVEQQTRMESLDIARAAYPEAGVEAEVAPFFRDMAGRLADAHLVIGRAGASTVVRAGGGGQAVDPGAAEDRGRRPPALQRQAAGGRRGGRGAAGEGAHRRRRCGRDARACSPTPPAWRKRAEAAKSVATPDAAERLADLVEATARV